MMRFFLLAIFIFVTVHSYAQIAAVTQIEQTNPLTKEKYIFPKITVQGFPASAKKINNKLRYEILDAEPGIADSRIFDQVWGNAQQSPTVSGLSYKVMWNSKSILSIQISAEGCGAYCEYWERYFTFNVKAGNQLLLDSIINDKGLHKLATDLNAYKQAKLRNKIKEIQDTLKTTQVKKDEESLAYFSGMFNLYNDCLDSEISYEYIAGMEFSVNSSDLVLYADRCSAHYNRNLDELWIFEYIANLKELSSYLTSYGRILVNR